MAKVSQKMIIEALRGNYGIILAAAKSLDISRNALYKRINRNEKLEKVPEESREQIVDIAEAKLIKRMSEGDT